MNDTVFTTGDLPNHAIPPIGPDGRWTREWWMFLVAIFNRTGGAGSPIDINTLQQADDISQGVPSTTQATQDALYGVEQLWHELSPPPTVNLSAVLTRLDMLETALQLTSDFSAVLQRIGEVESQLVEPKTTTAPMLEQWNAPALLNSWVNYGGAFNPAGYWKDPFGVVHLRGLVKSGTVGQAIFTLPKGYRPANTEAISVASADAFGELRIDGTGNIVAFVGSNTWMSMDSVTLRAAQ
jgi:hypothetical protein